MWESYSSAAQGSSTRIVKSFRNEKYFYYQDDLRQKKNMNGSTDKISQAMRVLEIQEKLDRGSISSNGSEEPLTEPEVAILKQVCSVSQFWFFLYENNEFSIGINSCFDKAESVPFISSTSFYELGIASQILWLTISLIEALLVNMLLV